MAIKFPWSGLGGSLMNLRKKNPLFNQRVNVSPYPDKILRGAAGQKLITPLAMSLGYKPDPSRVWGEATRMAGPSREVTVPGMLKSGLTREEVQEVLGEIKTGKAPDLQGSKVGATNIGELYLMQEAGQDVGRIETAMDKFWKKKLGYAK